MLTLEQLRARDFVLTEYPHLGLIHVGPAPLKNLKRSAWATEDLPYRSVVLDYGTGALVSAGFPKFFNYGEGGPSHIENSRVRKALAGEGPPATSTEKIDGSLAIRYTHNGEVRWRTRGTLNRTDMVEAIEEVALKYPFLADPGFFSKTSILFEFVHPDFQVVLRYPEPDLILVGAVDHDTFRMWTTDDLNRLAKVGYFSRAPESLCGPHDIEGLLHSIEHRRGSEGIVLRCGSDEQTLVKFKSADYLMRHRLRFSLNAKTIRTICIENHMTAMEDFDEWLDEQGADWELIQDVKPLVETFMTHRRIAAYSFEDLGASTARAMKDYPDRGDFAREFACKLPAAEKTTAFLLLDGKKTQAWEKFRDAMLDAAFEKFDKADANVLDY
jgi:hypothetical protein